MEGPPAQAGGFENTNMKRNGMVALVGRSNVGKSTLLNALVGKKVAAVSPKAQTTRNVIHGVLNSQEGQAVFVDTPGIFQLAKDVLTDKLNRSAEGALSGVDLICYMVDPTRFIGEEEMQVQGLLAKVSTPKILIINKIDADTPHLSQYRQIADRFDLAVEISALRGKHLAKLKKAIFEYLPEGEALYPQEQLTNVDRRFWIAEMIREHAFRHLGQELPYRIMVEVDKIEDEGKIIKIEARIITSQPRHKGMIIGKQAENLKLIGRKAREELEVFLGVKVFLEINVEVDEKWEVRF